VQDPNDAEIIKFSLRFYVGILLLMANQPLGWLALLICNALAIGRHSIFFTYLGFTLYALSWVVLGVGVLLAGPEGVRYSRLLMKRGWRSCTRFLRGGQR